MRRLRGLPPVWLAVPTLALAVALTHSGRPTAPAARAAAGIPAARAPVARAPAARSVARPAPRVAARLPSGTTPLVAIVHPTRPPIDLRGEQMLDLLAGRAGDWAALGQPADRLRLVVDPQAAAGAFWLWLLSGRAPSVRIRRAASAAAEVAHDRNAIAIVPADVAGPGVRTLTLDGRDPLLEPARYPLRARGEPPGRVVTAMAVGDILLSRTIHRKMVALRDFTSPFRDTWRRLAAADIAFANFEGTISADHTPLPGGTRFVSVPGGIRGMVKAGLDVLSLANNHTGDFGRDVLVETVRRLREAGIQTVGAGADDAAARAPVVVERAGVRFGFLSFNAIVGTLPPDEDTPGAVRIRMAPWFPLSSGDLDAFAEDVRALRPKVDVLIVYPHWGAEYTNTPNDDQRRVARALIVAGADMVIATHPHWVQGAEVYKGRLIAYSLGNFVFDQTWSRETQQAAGLDLVFWGKRLVRAEFVPVEIEDAHRPRFVGWSEGREILRRMWRGSGAPFSLGAAA